MHSGKWYELFQKVKSLNEDIQKGPYGWIQWKGTDVCCDIHCECGALTHIDADFAYSVRCSSCNKIYAMSPYIRLIPISEEEYIQLKAEGKCVEPIITDKES